MSIHEHERSFGEWADSQTSGLSEAFTNHVATVLQKAREVVTLWQGRVHQKEIDEQAIKISKAVEELSVLVDGYRVADRVSSPTPSPSEHVLQMEREARNAAEEWFGPEPRTFVKRAEAVNALTTIILRSFETKRPASAALPSLISVCPFCGSPALVSEWPGLKLPGRPRTPKLYSVECQSFPPYHCPMGKRYLVESKSAAIMAWNTRLAPSVSSDGNSPATSVSSPESTLEHYRDALVKLAAQLTCPRNETHYCPNCDTSLFNAKRIADEALASPVSSVERDTEQDLGEKEA